MPDKEQTDNPQTEPPVVDYAFWDVPGSDFKVIYSLPLFHEIDFVVNEGYRKIPHGGVEVGGLLFGRVDKKTLRIEAFRPIECEHANGPSLQLSEKDLDALQKQLVDLATDPDLSSLRPVGWFLAHTRSPLDMTEAEVKQFDRFFPEPFRLTVLVKPERFQATRFGFLVRNADGQMPREASASAVILPLPGRSQKQGVLIPSLAAPAPTLNAKRAQAKAEREVDEVDFEEAIAEDPPSSAWKLPPDAELTEEENESEQERFPAALSRQEEREARRVLARNRARKIGEAYPDTQEQPVQPAALPPVPFRPPPLPSLPANLNRTAGYDPYGRPAEQYDQEQAAAAASGVEAVLNTRTITALALAALLGCLVGYIAYLQLPAPVIPIDVRAVNQTVIVSWPPDETRNSIYAAIRLDDGPPVPLSAEEKRLGRVSLTSAKDLKVEVMARNFIRDSRGIVRYLHSANREVPLSPSQTSRLP